MTPLFVSKARAEIPASSVSQSSAMMPLTWHLAILVAGTVGAAAVNAPRWLLGLLTGLTAVTALLSWITYVRLVRTDRDALRRTETHVPAASSERAFVANAHETLRTPGSAPQLPSDNR
jgi:hypothetical protein